jgi:hypothetical protein
MRILGRLGAIVVGVFGSLVALLVNFVFSASHDLAKAFGSDLPQSHGFLGLLLILVAFIGALMALPRPRTSAALLVIAGVGFFFIVKGFALFASPFFFISAALAFFDRTPAPAKQPANVQQPH